MRAKSDEYEALAQRLAINFDVVGYSHGSEEGKTNRTCSLSKIKNNAYLKGCK
jgi:hypothetical protein